MNRQRNIPALHSTGNDSSANVQDAHISNLGTIRTTAYIQALLRRTEAGEGKNDAASTLNLVGRFGTLRGSSSTIFRGMIHQGSMRSQV